MKQGYTLIECMTTLGLIGALVIVAMLNTKRDLQSQRLHTEARLLAGAVRRLALLSRYEERELALKIEETGYETSPPNLIHRVFARDILARPTREIHFFPSGTVTPSTITLIEEGRSCSIIASLRARVRYTCSQ